ncbi:MAG: ester cyclase [Anaerolineae bacterium]|nr:ester cyclase [Anaerolineae bacterium]
MDIQSAKSLVYRYFDTLLNQRDISVCDALLAPDYVDHDAPTETSPGPASTKAYVLTLLENHLDLRVKIYDLTAEENRVAARIIWRGTHHLTGHKLHYMGIVLLRLNEQGQIAERWSAYQNL